MEFLPKEVNLIVITYLDSVEDLENLQKVYTLNLSNNDWVTLLRENTDFYKPELSRYPAKDVYYGFLIYRSFDLKLPSRLPRKVERPVYTQGVVPPVFVGGIPPEIMYPPSPRRLSPRRLSPRRLSPRAMFSDQNLLKGKEGLIREGMKASRADYTARTVIGPDPIVDFEIHPARINYSTIKDLSEQEKDYVYTFAKYVFLEEIPGLIISDEMIEHMDDLEVTKKYVESTEEDINGILLSFIYGGAFKSVGYILSENLADGAGGMISEAYNNFKIDSKVHQAILDNHEFDESDLIFLLFLSDERNFKYASDFIKKLPYELSTGLEVITDLFRDGVTVNYEILQILNDKYNVLEILHPEIVKEYYISVLKAIDSGEDIPEIKLATYLAGLKVVRDIIFNLPDRNVLFPPGR